MSSTWVNQYFVKFKERCRGGVHQIYRKKLSYGTPWGVPLSSPLVKWLLFPGISSGGILLILRSQISVMPPKKNRAHPAGGGGCPTVLRVLENVKKEEET
jgi:hypothetical protein